MKEQVIEERRDALSKYMNELVQHFNIFSDPDVCSFISMKDKEMMRTYFKSLYDYQESLIKLSGNKISDVSDKSGTSDEAPERGALNKSPIKVSPNPSTQVPNPLKQSFSTGGQSKF